MMNHAGKWLLSAIGLCACLTASAQFPMIGNMMPGLQQMQAIEMQRHQARTLLYREALEELRKNPKAADIADCPAVGQSAPGQPCIAQPKAEPPVLPAVPAENVQPAADSPRPPAKIRRALLIGNNAYPQPVPELETPVGDVERIARLLSEAHGFETRVLRNAGKAEMVEALNRIAAESSEDDSVLLMYAGHGYLMDDSGMGYWIPIDGSVKSPARWISNTDIAKFLRAIPARQIMLVSDSCFSGSLTREMKVVAVDTANVDEILKHRSVLVLSSGGEEPVSDEGKEGHSIFAWSLIQTIDRIRGPATGYSVFSRVRDQVVKEYPQTPQYGAVVSAGHAVGGEFLIGR